MPYVITKACIDIKDRSCVAVCPVDCILEVGRMRVVDPDVCIDCGACVPECPVDAIYADDDLPADLAEFADINATIAEGVDAVDALVDEYARVNGVHNVRAG